PARLGSPRPTAPASSRPCARPASTPTPATSRWKACWTCHELRRRPPPPLRGPPPPRGKERGGEGPHSPPPQGEGDPEGVEGACAMSKGPAWTEAFLEMMSVERAAAKNTLAAYARDLADAGGFLSGRGRDLADAAAEDVEAYF